VLPYEKGRKGRLGVALQPSKSLDDFFDQPPRFVCRFASVPLQLTPDEKRKIAKGATLMWTATALLLVATVLGGEEPIQADFVIRGAMLYDGSGQPGVKGDLAIRGDRIVGMGFF